MNETEKKTWRRCERIINKKKSGSKVKWTKNKTNKIKKRSYQVHG